MTALDGLGSVNAAFDANGNPTASALFRPYGGLRYSSGAMPGSIGFTGRHTDAAVTGLDYYNARYYDPAAGAFATADMLSLDAKGAAGGKTRAVLARYTYVENDPETYTDPSGHIRCELDDSGRCIGGGSNGGGGQKQGGSNNPQTTPGCKGTQEQCQQWQTQQANEIRDKEGEQDLLWALMGGIEGIFDFMDLIKDWKKDAVAAAIDALGLLGDIITSITYVMQWLQLKGQNVGGIEQFLGGLGAIINYVAAPLKALKNAPGYLADFDRFAVTIGWDGLRLAAIVADPIGFVTLIGSIVLTDLDIVP